MGRFQGGLELLGHHREGFVPGNGCEFPSLVEAAVFFAQQGLR